MANDNVLPDGAPSAVVMAGGQTFLIVSRRDIEAGDYHSVMQIANIWMASAASLSAAAASASLVVDGYNEDPRDLTVIPEVESYFKELSKLLPELPIFLLQQLPEMYLYLSLAAGAKRMSYQPTSTAHTQYFHMDFPSGKDLASVCFAFSSAIQHRLWHLRIADEHPVRAMAKETERLLFQAAAAVEPARKNA
ncbi:hypothetical protein ACQHIH_21480 (plasmid) [Xanthomonas sontii]|uniref:hypothetical protein n=1 Tax=Xanthomonas sontii TaxID=2650745 RepID=UPI003F831BEE